MSNVPPDVFEMGPTTLRSASVVAPQSTLRHAFVPDTVPLAFRVSRQQLHTGTRRKLQEGMQQALSKDQLGVAVLKGGGPFHIYSTDMEGIFR